MQEEPLYQTNVPSSPRSCSQQPDVFGKPVSRTCWAVYFSIHSIAISGFSRNEISKTNRKRSTRLLFGRELGEKLARSPGHFTMLQKEKALLIRLFICLVAVLIDPVPLSAGEVVSFSIFIYKN